MRSLRLFTLTIGLFFLVATASAQNGPPKAPVHEVTDTYFGQQIVDPYRWMEDSKSSETAEWMKAESQYTRAYLDPFRLSADLLKRLSELSDAGVRVSSGQRCDKMNFYDLRAPNEPNSPREGSK